MSRPSINQYMIELAKVVATRSTCARRKVGAIIVDKNNHILSTGYNGVAKGVEHCIDSPCLGADYSSGLGLDLCKALHAEVNAIAHCRDLQSAFAIYTTVSPCMSCIKLIMATNIRKIVTTEVYSEHALEYWNSIGGEYEII